MKSVKVLTIARTIRPQQNWPRPRRLKRVEDQTPDAESAAYKAHFCSLGSLIPPRYTRKNNFIFSIMTLTGSCMCGGVHYSVEGIFCSSIPFEIGLIGCSCSGQLSVCALPLHRLPKGILNTSLQVERDVNEQADHALVDRRRIYIQCRGSPHQSQGDKG